jgi:RNA polymerase sigma-70 factor (ECF subfamily)
VLRAEAVTCMQRALVERARDGDLDAFSQLAKASFPKLDGIANLILRDSDRAQDAVQDALLRAWRDLRATRDPDAWDAWLRRLTVRACYDVARKQRRRTRMEVQVEPDPTTARTPDPTADVADRDWLGRELIHLDIDQRAVIVLHYYLDLPVTEVAEILDIPYGTAASRLHRGLEAMRSSMRVGSESASVPATERST